MPKRSRRELTDAFVRKAPALNGRRTSYTDAIVPGFELRVHPDGRRMFAFRYEDARGRSIRLALGQYGAADTHGRVTLAAAREAAAKFRGQTRSGSDPRAEQRAEQQRLQNRSLKTVDDLIDAYLTASKARVRASTWNLNQQRLNTHVRPKIGTFAIEALGRTDVRRLVLEIGATRPATARAVAGLIGSIYRHARIDLEMSVANPAESLQKLIAKTTRDRVLTDEELSKIWRAVCNPQNPKAPLTPSLAMCIRLAGLTLQRSIEAVGAHDREFDLRQKIWTIPAARSKNRREHLVPLSDSTIQVIEDARRERGSRDGPGPLFPSVKNRDEPMDRHSLTRAMARLCAWLGISDAGMHDLRRTGATNLTSERIGIPRFHVSAVLGHVSETGGVTAIYDRNNYIIQKRQALRAWADLLESIAAS